jgi:hypothetical protein
VGEEIPERDRDRARDAWREAMRFWVRIASGGGESESESSLEGEADNP